MYTIDMNIVMNKKMINRIIVYAAGLLVLAVGITMNTKTNLGVSPIISVPFTISTLSGINFGDMTMVVYCVFVLTEMLLHCWHVLVAKEHESLKELLIKDALQIPVCIVFTRFLNVFSRALPSVSNNLPLQLVYLCAAIVLTGIGAAMSLNMRIVPNPGDGIVQVLSDTTRLHGRRGKGVGFCKNCFDGFNVCLSFIIGLVSGNFLLGLGLGTICAAIGVGRVIHVFNRLTSAKIKALTDM